jgi:DNA polymerase III gamma/tau subunit
MYPVKSFNEFQATLKEDEVVVRTVEEVVKAIPYKELLELLKAELEKDPKTVAHDLLALIKPASCLSSILSLFNRK